MDYSPPGCSVHGILQAGTLEGVAIPFCRGSSRPRDWAPVSCTARGFFTVWATRKPLSLIQFYSAAAEFCSTHRQMLFPRTPLGGRTGQITAMVLNLCRHGDHLPNSSLSFWFIRSAVWPNSSQVIQMCWKDITHVGNTGYRNQCRSIPGPLTHASSPAFRVYASSRPYGCREE